jgi:hypothetical protein
MCTKEQRMVVDRHIKIARSLESMKNDALSLNHKLADHCPSDGTGQDILKSACLRIVMVSYNRFACCLDDVVKRELCKLGYQYNRDMAQFNYMDVYYPTRGHQGLYPQSTDTGVMFEFVVRTVLLLFEIDAIQQPFYSARSKGREEVYALATQLQSFLAYDRLQLPADQEALRTQCILLITKYVQASDSEQDEKTTS